MVTIKRRTSWGTVATISALICLGLFSFFKPKISFLDKGHENRPDFEFQDVRITQYLLDQPEFDIDADRGTVDRHTNRVDLIRMTGRFYTADGESMGIQSPTASLSVVGSLIQIQNVSISLLVGSAPAVLTAADLEWNGATGHIVCRGGISMQTAKYTIRGDQFEGNIPVRNFKIDRKARAEIVL
jgi:hypothetical protein